jgi:hypothetical protein
VIEVTNLNDAGLGSLRQALEVETGPRMVVFRTGGTIELNNPIRVRQANSFLTVAGQTAPGDGIQLKNYGLWILGGAHDMVLRYLRLRPGTADPAGLGGDQIDGLTVWGSDGSHIDHVVIDHVDMTWAIDENGQNWEWVTDVTYQWSIFAEGSTTGHPKGPHSMGLLVGGDSRNTVSVHHSLFAHNAYRNPLFNEDHIGDFRNNLVYNWGREGSAEFDRVQVNFVNNHYLGGPNSVGKNTIGWVYNGAKIYLDGNWGPNCPTGCVDDWDIGFIEGNQARDRVFTPFPVPPVTTHPTSQVKDIVLANAGATLPMRDAVDTRIVQDVRNGTGHVGIGSGYPTLAAGTPPADSDHDGMPDTWETAHGLNPTNASDGPQVSPNGYTHLENYLNELAGDPVPGVGLRGDLNGDDQVTLADLRQLLRMLIGQEPANDEAKSLAAPADRLTLADARELMHLLVSP